MGEHGKPPVAEDPPPSKAASTSNPAAEQLNENYNVNVAAKTNKKAVHFQDGAGAKESPPPRPPKILILPPDLPIPSRYANLQSLGDQGSSSSSLPSFSTPDLLLTASASVSGSAGNARRMSEPLSSTFSSNGSSAASGFTEEETLWLIGALYSVPNKVVDRDEGTNGGGMSGVIAKTLSDSALVNFNKPGVLVGVKAKENEGEKINLGCVKSHTAIPGDSTASGWDKVEMKGDYVDGAEKLLGSMDANGKGLGDEEGKAPPLSMEGKVEDGEEENTPPPSLATKSTQTSPLPKSQQPSSSHSSSQPPQPPRDNGNDESSELAKCREQMKALQLKFEESDRERLVLVYENVTLQTKNDQLVIQDIKIKEDIAELRTAYQELAEQNGRGIAPVAAAGFPNANGGGGLHDSVHQSERIAEGFLRQQRVVVQGSGGNGKGNGNMLFNIHEEIDEDLLEDGFAKEDLAKAIEASMKDNVASAEHVEETDASPMPTSSTAATSADVVKPPPSHTSSGPTANGASKEKGVSDVAKLQSDLRECREQKADAREEVANLKDYIANEQDVLIKQLKTTIEKQRDELTLLKKRNEQRNMDDRNNVKNRNGKSRDSLRMQKKVLVGKKKELEEEISKLEKQVEKVSKENERISMEKDEVIKDNRNMRGRITMLQREVLMLRDGVSEMKENVKVKGG